MSASQRWAVIGIWAAIGTVGHYGWATNVLKVLSSLCIFAMLWCAWAEQTS